MASEAPPLPAAAAATATESTEEASSKTSSRKYTAFPCPVSGSKKPNPHTERNNKVLAALRKDSERYMETGPVRWGDFDKGTDLCNSIPSKAFQVRGPKYLEDGVKIPSSTAAFRFVGLTNIMAAEPVFNIAAQYPRLKKKLAKADCPYLFIINFLVPHTTGTLLTPMVFARTLDVGKDPQFDKTFDRFINGDDTERNNTFKMIVNILKAPFTVTASLKMFGGMKPILTGNKIGQKYFAGKNYFEIDMDIGASAVARKVSGLILSNFRSMICDLGFVLQAGHQEGELPERLIGTVRTRECDLTRTEGFPKAHWAKKEAPEAAAPAPAPAAAKKSFYFF